jgi:hypothetical protein
MTHQPLSIYHPLDLYQTITKMTPLEEIKHHIAKETFAVVVWPDGECCLKEEFSIDEPSSKSDDYCIEQWTQDQIDEYF